MRIFDRKHETLPREELVQLQTERVQALLARIRAPLREVPEAEVVAVCDIVPAQMDKLLEILSSAGI